jgi:hypothetical protein
MNLTSKETFNMRTSHKLTSLLLTLAAMAVLAVSAMAQTPGTPGTTLKETADSPVSDQKAGSILFYNYYTSSTTNATEGTVFNITNTNTTQSVLVHLFFVDQSCAAKDFYVCLTRNQTSSFKAADFDPDTKGYLVAVATDGDGCPISFNYLIGDEYIKTSDGFNANLGAEAIAAVSPGVPTTDANGDTRNRIPSACNPTSATGTLKFDGTDYNQLPYTVALDNVGNLTDTETLFILNAVGGSLIDGGQSVGSVFGLLYNDIEQQLSFSFSSGRCQFTTKISDAWPSTAPRFSSFVTRSGWIKLYSTGGRAYLGAAIARAKTAAGFSGGHNLHKLTYRSNAVYTIPVFPTTCNQAIL